MGTLTALLAVLGVLAFFYIQKVKKDRETEEYNRGVAAEKSGTGSGDRLIPLGGGASDRRLAAHWVYHPTNTNKTQSASEYELLLDGTLRWKDDVYKRFEMGKWRLKSSQGDTGVIEIDHNNGDGWIPYRFTLTDGGSGLELVNLIGEDGKPGGPIKFMLRK